MASTDSSRGVGQPPRAKPGTVQEVHVPKRKYLMIDGTAEPGDQDYQDAIQGLYSCVYTIKFLPKSGIEVIDYEPFSVEPLEGLYSELDPAQNWTLLIAVPDFVTDETVQLARESMRRKGKEIDSSVRLEEWEQGDVIQTLHIGPYDKEQPAVEMLHRYAETNDYALAGRQNEIYLNDPRRVAPDRIKVIIRYQVKK